MLREEDEETIKEAGTLGRKRREVLAKEDKAIEEMTEDENGTEGMQEVEKQNS